MSSKKINCWEFMKCGRGPSEETGETCEKCPAALKSAFDGMNEGTNAGRSCWLVAGTFCNEKPVGTFAEKLASCRDCAFYKQVSDREGQSSLHIQNIDIFAYTHPGLVRPSNEDRYLIKTMEDESLLLAVADGLGGDVSSDFAAEITKGKLAGLRRLRNGNESEELETFVKKLDLIIRHKADSHPELANMATTLICIVLKSDIIHWINVGDSRFYILRDDRLIQVTEDQTLARALVAQGELTPEEAKDHFSRKILDQCVGYGISDPETGSVNVMKEDLLILSSDGLYNMVPETSILAILKGPETIEEKTKALVNAALRAGGEDNITIVLAHIKEILFKSGE